MKEIVCDSKQLKKHLTHQIPCSLKSFDELTLETSLWHLMDFEVLFFRYQTTLALAETSSDPNFKQQLIFKGFVLSGSFANFYWN